MVTARLATLIKKKKKWTNRHGQFQRIRWKSSCLIVDDFATNEQTNDKGEKNKVKKSKISKLIPKNEFVDDFSRYYITPEESSDQASWKTTRETKWNEEETTWSRA